MPDAAFVGDSSVATAAGAAGAAGDVSAAMSFNSDAVGPAGNDWAITSD